MNIKTHYFGQDEMDKRVELYVLTNNNGMAIKLMNYGARIVEWHCPDRNGCSDNIALGFDNLGQYLKPNPYFGATIGRYANRIAHAKFDIDRKPFYTPANEGANTLHGGLIGFDRRLWITDQVEHGGNVALRLQYFSNNNEEGFPGNLRVSAVFVLLDDNQLQIEYSATTDLPTVVNLTNHSYFNLKGAGNGSILDHRLTIHADHYTPTNESLIPTGEVLRVAGTPLDFTTPHEIGERIQQVPHGYDLNYVLDGEPRQLKPAARLEEHSTGRVLEIQTTQPGIQLYSGNRLDGTLTGNGGAYDRYAGVCLEPQHFPDSPNRPNFPSTVLRPEQEYRQTVIYQCRANV